jgi:hypothetical protein
MIKNKKKGMVPLLAAVLQKKSDYRRQQARLPFERKIEIVVRLQHLVAEIGKSSGRKPSGKAWRLGKLQDSKVKGTRVSMHAARD